MFCLITQYILFMVPGYTAALKATQIMRGDPILPLRDCVCVYVCVCGGGGGGAELFPCPYQPKVQARPPRDQRPALPSRVSGQGLRD